MLARARVFSLTIAALLVLTLMHSASIIAAPPSPGRMATLLPVEVEWTQRPRMAARLAAGMSTTADAQNVEFVGHIGGATYAVAVQGNYAYIGEGYRECLERASEPSCLQ